MLLRVWLPDRPGALGAVASRIGAVRGDIVGIDVLERNEGVAIDEFGVVLADADHLPLLVREVEEVDGCRVEHVTVVTHFPDPRLDALVSVALVCEADDARALQKALATYAGSAFQADWVAVMRGRMSWPSCGNPPADSYLAALAEGAASSPAVASGLPGPPTSPPRLESAGRCSSSGAQATSSASGNGPSCWPWPASPTTSGTASTPVRRPRPPALLRGRPDGIGTAMPVALVTGTSRHISSAAATLGRTGFDVFTWAVGASRPPPERSVRLLRPAACAGARRCRISSAGSTRWPPWRVGSTGRLRPAGRRRDPTRPPSPGGLAPDLLAAVARALLEDLGRIAARVAVVGGDLPAESPAPVARARPSVGDADAASGLGAVAGQLPVEVEPADPLAGLDGAVVELVGRDDPGDLELEPVGVLAVEALRRAVVAGADERPGVRQGAGQALELGQRVDLPGQVVEPDRAAPPGRRGGRRPAPISNRPRSWSLVEPGACRNAAPENPSGIMLSSRNPSTSV